MIKNWWKYLGAALVLYSLLAGMLIPLGTGITNISQSTVSCGSTEEIDIIGYNTNWSKGLLTAYLHNSGEYFLPAKHVEISSDQKARLTFQMPTGFPSKDEAIPLSLVLSHTSDKLAILPDALALQNKDCSDSKDNWLLELPTFNANDNSRVFPFRNILRETIRNTYYHVPMWFGMFGMLLGSIVFGFLYLRTGRVEYDLWAFSLTTVGFLFGIIGLVTGMLWAEFTWGQFWSWDIKQSMSLLSLVIYAAYFILRKSIVDDVAKRNFSAVYSILGCVAVLGLLFIIPRMQESLHPGNGGNPAMGGEALDKTMHMVFYPAVIGWILMGYWISQLLKRFLAIKLQFDDKNLA